MPSLVSMGLTTAGIWCVAAVFLWWPLLPAHWRRGLSLSASAAGLAFLLVAINTEGLHESPTLTVFLVGAPYVTQPMSASASLPYYVLTGFFLLIGSAGLAVGDRLADALAQRLVANAVALTLAIALVRFALEKTAAPQGLSQLFGVTWLAPVVGAYLYLNAAEAGRKLRRIALALLGYALAVRVAVAGMYVMATTARLGTHYDLTPLVRVVDPLTRNVVEFEPGSARQLLGLAVLPQLVVWPVYTLLSGLIGAGLAGMLSSVWSARGNAPRAPRPARQAD